jgi:hypothetical protein
VAAGVERRLNDLVQQVDAALFLKFGGKTFPMY